MPTRLLFVASALATFVLIPSANAATYCVGKPTCEGVAKVTLTDALVASDQTPEVDDIQVGIGEYPGHWQNAAGRPVRITGQGALTTIVPDDVNHPGLAITGAASTVSNLSVQLNQNAVFATALRLDGGARGDRIGVSNANGANNDIGVELGAGTSLTQSDIALGGGLGGMTGVRIVGDGVTLSDVDIAAARGVRVLGDAIVRRARIASGDEALRLDGGTTRVDSVLLDVREGGTGINAFAKADVSQVTIVGGDAPGRVGLKAYDSAAMTVRDTIVAGMPVTYNVPPTARLTLDHVVRSPAAKAAGAATDTAPITVAPQFAGIGTAPFALAPGSALVDAGSDTPLAAGESAFDLSGNPRLSDGNGDCAARRDPGAYETVAAACVAPVATPEPVVAPTPIAPPAATPVATPIPAATDHTAPAITKLAFTRAKVSFRLSEAATVKLTVQRKQGRRYVTARTLTKASRAGANSVALRLRAGHYRVLVDAVDLAGNRVSIRRSL